MVVSIKTGFYAEMETDMKKLENKCMLITYSDSMGHNLADLNEILDKYFKNAVGLCGNLQLPDGIGTYG